MSHSSVLPPAVVITGASSGIGQACAMELDRRGFRVFAGVRSEHAAETLKAEMSSRATPLLIDVTEADTIVAAAEAVAKTMGNAGLAGLVNNAGIVVSGPVEAVPLHFWRRQIEVNLIGQVAVIQAFLPLLRKARGRVVNIGSINGALAAPYLGPYSASKFALEAVTDALRVELRSLGIQVSAVEPGAINTPIWQKSIAAADQLSEKVAPEILSLYEADLTAMRRMVDRSAQAAMPVESVVRAVIHALTAKRPKTRYFLGWHVRLPFTGMRMLNDRLRDWIVRKLIGLT
jgi:NAD(P)-dependent dehydrogenase (short-subunit alcohol dehydrogenase family)